MDRFGIGQALLEHAACGRESRQFLTSTFEDGSMPRAADAAILPPGFDTMPRSGEACGASPAICDTLDIAHGNVPVAAETMWRVPAGRAG